MFGRPNDGNQIKSRRRRRSERERDGIRHPCTLLSPCYLSPFSLQGLAPVFRFPPVASPYCGFWKTAETSRHRRNEKNVLRTHNGNNANLVVLACILLLHTLKTSSILNCTSKNSLRVQPWVGGWGKVTWV